MGILRYLVLEYGQVSDQLILSDLTGRPEVELLLWRPPGGGLLRNVWRKATGERAAREALLAAAGRADCLIVLAYCLLAWDEALFRRLRSQYPDLRLVLLLWDSLGTRSPMMEAVRPKILGWPWDLVISFDKGDCEAHGFAWLGLSYYSMVKVQPQGENCDICFVGADTEGRRALLQAVRCRIHSGGGRCDFTLVPRLGRARRFAASIFPCILPQGEEGLRFSAGLIPYRELLARAMSANCLLELVQPGQRTQTLRYFEAVCYGKKLLTNNPGVRELPFYDERYMRVFEEPGDIDVAWVRQREHVSYGYGGEFSPARILDIIEAHI